MKKILPLLIALTVLLSGCVSAPTKSIWKGNLPAENEYFYATFHPLFNNKAYAITIKNKTENELEINWDKTLYMLNGRTKGRFMLPDTNYSDRNNSRPNDIIFPRDKLVITVYPSHLVAWEKQFYIGGSLVGGWKNKPIPVPSSSGIYLTIMADGVEITEKITGAMKVANKSNREFIGPLPENKSR